MQHTLQALLFSVALVLGSARVASATPTNDVVGGVLYSGYISYLQVKYNKGLQVQLKNASGVPLTCSGSANQFAFIDAGLPAVAAHQDVLTAALLAGKSVDLYYEAISGVCWVKAVLVR
jgi:hypothetical protein